MAYLQRELVSLVIATVTLWQVHGRVSQVNMPPPLTSYWDIILSMNSIE